MKKRKEKNYWQKPGYSLRCSNCWSNKKHILKCLGFVNINVLITSGLQYFRDNIDKSAFLKLSCFLKLWNLKETFFSLIHLFLGGCEVFLLLWISKGFSLVQLTQHFIVPSYRHVSVGPLHRVQQRINKLFFIQAIYFLSLSPVIIFKSVMHNFYSWKYFPQLKYQKLSENCSV